MDKIKTIIIGTSEFAVPILEAALAHPMLEVAAIVTQPDRPAGREQTLKPSAVKQFLLDKKSEITIIQPEKIKDISGELLDEYEPELIIVASYGQIIPNNILEYPKYKCLNFHGSLLPKLRGAVPVNMAILLGFEKTGVTLQIMAEKMDVGDIISTREYILKPDETAESLMAELSMLSVEILNQDLEKWILGQIQPSAQDESEATYCYRGDISKDKAEIKFETDIDLAERMIRAFYPWPVVWFELPGKGRVKIFKAKKSDIQSQATGLQLTKSDKKLLLNLQNGTLELLELQLEGKKRDSVINYYFLVN